NVAGDESRVVDRIRRQRFPRRAAGWTIRRFGDQICGDIKNIRLDKVRRLLVDPEQLLDFATKLLIVAARLVEESGALAWLAFEIGLEEFVNLLPTVGFHRQSLR